VSIKSTIKEAAIHAGVGIAARKGAIAIVTASAALLASVASWEGTEHKPYKDVVGVLTVCNGHTKNVVPNKVYTKAECDALLTQDLTEHGQGVLNCVKVPIPQGVYDGLASFAFNVGVGATCKSRAVALINQAKFIEGCNAIAHGPPGWRTKPCNTRECHSRRQANADPAWSYAGGKFYKGLHNRRLSERDMCLDALDRGQG
jgi:lysozyme